MHDAPEAYIGDVSKPLKALLKDYCRIEAKIEAAIASRFGLELPLPEAVKRIDIVMLLTEQRQLLHNQKPWIAPENMELPRRGAALLETPRGARPVPETLQGAVGPVTKLLAVQTAALKAAYRRRGFAYFMEMGLGKSLTALTEFMDLVNEHETTRMVVVCPNSFKSGWRDEVEKHDIGVDCFLFSSGAERDNRDFLSRRYTRPPLIVVNYEATRSAYTKELLINFIRTKPTYIVFDESIQIKTHNALQTKSAIEISQYAHYRRVLSGKPITQGPHDLWGQMRAIGQLDGRNFYAFRNMFCRMGGFKNKQVIGAINEDMLAGMIEPHIFRATKSQWLDLPGKVYTTREYTMSKEQRKQYDAMEDNFVLWLTDDKAVTIEAAITKYEKLLQIQCGFIIDESTAIHDLVPLESNPRLNALREIIEDEVTGKVIIVYVHRHSCELLLKALKHLNPVFIRGGMSPDEVNNNKRAFNENPTCRCILLQATAGKYGHTLLGDKGYDSCATTIFFENSYSLDTRSQIEDRNHRFGQTATSVTYVDFYATSMDKKVIKALQRKESIFNAIFDHIKSAIKAA